MTTNEFSHYDGCEGRDTQNCSGCALTNLNQDSPNYAAWPLAYMENRRAIPAKWRAAFKAEMARTDNPYYVENLKRTWKRFGVHFTDGKDIYAS
jgi:hypothetical protein